MKPILYIDMDNVIVDFKTGIEKLDQQTLKEYQGRYDEVKGIFSLMKPIEGAIEAVKELSKNTIFTSYQLLRGITVLLGATKTNGLKNISALMRILFYIKD